MPGRVDDPSIGDDEVLWRRIIPEWVQHEPDGQVRPSSIAFIDRRSGEVSVHLASILIDPARALAGRPADSLAAVQVRHPRTLGYAIVRDPQPDDPSHALICPCPTKSHARQLARQSTWVVPPAGA